MSNQDSFWRRMGKMFRSDSGDAEPDSANQAHTLATATRDEADVAGGVFNRLPDPQSVPWWRRSQARQAHTRELSVRVTELVGAMQQHFEKQDQRSEQIAGSLDRMGNVLEQLADAQRSNGEYLRAVAEHAEAAAQRTNALNETVGRVPDALLTQAEAIRSVARQVEVSQESNTQLMHSLQQFGRAVDTLGTSGTAQIEVLQKLNSSQREQHDALTTLVREQGRRFVVLMIIAAIIAAVGLVALTIGALLQMPTAGS